MLSKFELKLFEISILEHAIIGLDVIETETSACGRMSSVRVIGTPHRTENPTAFSILVM